jgi:hypothetical protein
MAKQAGIPIPPCETKWTTLSKKLKFKIITMNWQTVFNPFSKFSEKQLFIFGFLFFSLSWFVFYTNKNG